MCDITTVDAYARNSNANRYADSWNADAVAKIRATFGVNEEVWAWHEANDLKLSPPPLPATNRAPSPTEINAGVAASVSAGAVGIGWFLTGLKWGWPTGYLPPVDRNGVSMAPQYATCKAIGQALHGLVVQMGDDVAGAHAEAAHRPDGSLRLMVVTQLLASLSVRSAPARAGA